MFGQQKLKLTGYHMLLKKLLKNDHCKIFFSFLFSQSIINNPNIQSQTSNKIQLVIIIIVILQRSIFGPFLDHFNDQNKKNTIILQHELVKFSKNTELFKCDLFYNNQLKFCNKINSYFRSKIFTKFLLIIIKKVTFKQFYIFSEFYKLMLQNYRVFLFWEFYKKIVIILQHELLKF